MFKVIVTIGPSTLNYKMIKEINSSGDCIFRINGSHMDISDIEKTINVIKSWPLSLKLMIDLPGNKIRTSGGFKTVRFKKGDTIIFKREDINFRNFYKILSLNDRVFTNDSLNSFLVKNIDYRAQTITFEAENDGILTKNKGLHPRGKEYDMPFILDKDREIINIINKYDVDFCALSFVRSMRDIKETSQLIKNGVNIIAKIEKKVAIDNLNEILQAVDNILIDRGDLSNDVGILNLPFYQSFIINKAKKENKRVFLATQFLKSMTYKRVPLIAEIMGLYNDISLGITVIQLSEETAVGNYPKECIDVIFAMYRNLSRQKERIEVK